MKRVFIVVALAVVAIALARFVIIPRIQSVTETDPTTLSLYGNVEIRQVELAFRISGRLEAMMFDEGDPVTVGDVIARLDAVPMSDALNQVKAEASVRAAELSKLKAGSRRQEIERAQARVEEIEAGIVAAQLTFNRQKILVEKGFASQKALDDSLAILEVAKKRLVAAQKDLALVKLGPRPEEIAAGTAAYNAAEAATAQAQLKLDDAVLLAPDSGVLLSRVREPGSIVQAGTPIATLALTKPIWVRAYVNETDLGVVAPGTAALVYTDSNPAHPYTGKIGFVSPVAEFTPRTVQTPDLRTDLVYQLRVIVDAPDQGLRQGMPVTVKIKRSSPKN
jgi:HlyD family secretion protein